VVLDARLITVVYHCVTRSKANRMRRPAMRAEAGLCAEADAVFVTRPACWRLRPQSAPPLPNVANGATSPGMDQPWPCRRTGPPASAHGSASGDQAYKLDLSCWRLGGAIPLSFCVIGPVGEGDLTDWRHLAAWGNVHCWLFTKPYNALPL